MTQRMHPEDLRALIAGMHSAQLFLREEGVDSVGWTDLLLAELAKTAKPEPTPTIEEVTEGRTVTVYPCPKCGETDPEAKHKSELAVVAENHGWDGFEPIAAWVSRAVEDNTRRINDFMTLQNKNMTLLIRAEAAEARIKELEAALQTARAEGAREERERILKVLLVTNPMDVSFCDNTHGDGWFVDALIQLLEPKP